MVPVSTMWLGLWSNNALQLRHTLVRQAGQSTKTNDRIKPQTTHLEENQMQTQPKTERFFSIELNSKHQIKNMTLTNDGQKNGALIEGTIGNLIEATFTEDVILEVTGTKGTLRLDIQAKEIKENIFTNKRKS
jgi:hypothetical protein